jgi:hypothetical protein
MTVKIHINAATGLFEIEGDAEFVLRVYEDVKAILKDRLQRSTTKSVNEAPVDESETANNGETRIKKGRKISAKRSGPSCADRIVALKTKSFLLSRARAVTSKMD